jgi:hypothetical protein
MSFDYKNWLKTAQDRLELLKQQRTGLDVEIAQLEQGIRGFARLAEEPGAWSGPDVGITEGMRQLFRNNRAVAYTPTEVRDELLARGITMDQQNPMAVIHQVIARLQERRYIGPISLGGKQRYRFLGRLEEPKTTKITVREKRK